MPVSRTISPRQSLVPNFRNAAGLNKIYRCSAPDNVADLLQQGDSRRRKLLESEHFILYDATLVIDLRSSFEVDEEKQRALIERAPGGAFEEIHGLDGMMKSISKRQLLRLKNENFTKSDFTSYVAKNKISPQDWEKACAEKTQGELVYQTINACGLTGLNEAILETKVYICAALRATTIHLEARPDGKVIFHCSIGKDRAGIFAMLCESILGVSDEDIINDFAMSSGIAALAELRFNEIFQGKVDALQFSTASPETMRMTLKYLRGKYGSIANYLDSVGFDDSWRQRFVRVAS